MGRVYKLKYKSVIVAAITLFIVGHMHDEMIIERDKWMSFERHKTIEHTCVLRYIKKGRGSIWNCKKNW